MSDREADQPPPGQRTPPPIPADMKEFNRGVIAEFRANGGKLSGPMAGRTVLLLTTQGVRSGQPRTTVVGFGRHGDDYVVIASNNGAASHPAWYRNLLANPRATVEVGAEKFEATASTAAPEDREELAATVPYLERQQKLTVREIPLVTLRRVAV